MAEEWDVDALLREVGFDEEDSALTRRQAEVLALREHGAAQADIADLLGTSRANVSGVEASARRNVAQARETIALVEALAAPAQVRVDAGTDVYDLPDRVYEACEAAGVKVGYSGAELMRVVGEAAGDAVAEREVLAPLTVGVTEGGEVRVRRRDDG